MVSQDFNSVSIRKIKTIFKDTKTLRIYANDLVLIGLNNKVIDKRYVVNKIKCAILEKLVTDHATFYRIDEREMIFLHKHPAVNYVRCNIIIDPEEFYDVINAADTDISYNDTIARFTINGKRHLYFGDLPTNDLEKNRKSDDYFMNYYVDFSKKKIFDTRANAILDYVSVVVNDMS